MPGAGGSSGARPQQKRWRPAPSASPTLACSFVVGFCVVLGWKAVAAVARRNRARMVLVVAAARVAAPSERLGLVVLVAHPFTQYELRQLPPDVFVGCLRQVFCNKGFCGSVGGIVCSGRDANVSVRHTSTGTKSLEASVPGQPPYNVYKRTPAQIGPAPPSRIEAENPHTLPPHAVAARHLNIRTRAFNQGREPTLSPSSAAPRSSRWRRRPGAGCPWPP